MILIQPFACDCSLLYPGMRQAGFAAIPRCPHQATYLQFARRNGAYMGDLLGLQCDISTGDRPSALCSRTMLPTFRLSVAPKLHGRIVVKCYSDCQTADKVQPSTQNTPKQLAFSLPRWLADMRCNYPRAALLTVITPICGDVV